MNSIDEAFMGKTPAAHKCDPGLTKAGFANVQVELSLNGLMLYVGERVARVDHQV
jgi:hypothetical protein